MAELKKHALLLSLMAILFIAKFVLVPIFDWQDNKLQTIKSLEKKQQKINRVLAGSDDNARLNAELSQVVNNANKLFFAYQTESAFKLSQQKMLETLLKKHQLKPERIGWQTSSELADLSVTRYQVQLRFSGQTLKMIEFITALESHERLVEISEFNVSLKGQNNQQLGQTNGSVTLRLYGMGKA